MGILIYYVDAYYSYDPAFIQTMYYTPFVQLQFMEFFLTCTQLAEW